MKIIKNLYNRTSGILNEGLVDDIKKIVGADEETIRDAIKDLEFADHIELGNAVDREDTDEINEILGLTGMEIVDDEDLEDSDKVEEYELTDEDLEELMLDEADNPYKTVTPPSEQMPSKTLSQQGDSTEEPGEEERSALGRKDVEDLEVGDEVEVADLGGDPEPARIRSLASPGETLVVTGEDGREHIVRKDNVLGTPKLDEDFYDPTGQLDSILTSYVHGRLSYEEALEKIETMPLPGVDSEAEDALKNIAKFELGFLEPERIAMGEPVFNSVQNDAESIEEDELRKLRSLAGIKETASAGATSAGAIASSPSTSSGMHKRNPSIYSANVKNTKKPTPKERKKKEEGSGLGRNKKD